MVKDSEALILLKARAEARREFTYDTACMACHQDTTRHEDLRDYCP